MVVVAVVDDYLVVCDAGFVFVFQTLMQRRDILERQRCLELRLPSRPMQK